MGPGTMVTMSSSSRTSWSLLLLRLAVGGMALLQGVTALVHAKGAITFPHVRMWALDLVQAVAGALVLIGLWLPVSAGILAVLVGWPLVMGWAHGQGPLAQPERLFRLLVTLASAVGGAGRWGVGK